ncbi:TolC family protein [Polaribacter ponticola]|uniref:TolC family protein n=1 Tax=Polaribacter ponticola TaxID=2978475 RepID=A0ABT5S4M0_9FLAO|nr:TolC family protein [Polaribacter sp. MSW5]MDD7913062.1 TolC family protein [Polaribacter sp. MSW5]
MKKLKNIIVVILVFCCTNTVFGQIQEENSVDISSEILTFEEFLGFVKKHHPLVKQANLTLSIGEANLLKARGGFDPKIEVDFDRKKFKNIEYYEQLNSTFKIPTWFGVELKANFEQNSGQFLDPSLTVPNEGLYSAGFSFSLAQGLLINDRMAALKKAKIFVRQSQADRELLVNEIIVEASKAYFEWLQATNEQKIYTNFLDNAQERLLAVERSVEEGDKAAIDFTEARITFQNRKLELEAAKLNGRKASLKVSNFLWLNEVPLQLEEEVLPKSLEIEILENILNINSILNNKIPSKNHPKLLSLQAKIDGLEVERKLNRNNLLPKVDLQYNFLSEDYDKLNTFNTANYKAFVNLSFPIFLRKERGNLKLTNYKIQDAEFEQDATILELTNKLNAIRFEINSLSEQVLIIEEIVIDYETLVSAEERKFSLGESSLFLINTREQKLIDARLKENALFTKRLKSYVSYFNVIGLADPS